MARNNFCKSTLIASGYSQTVQANGQVTFGTSSTKTGNAISLSSGSNIINLKRAGLYQITLSGTATGAAEDVTVTMQINRNGIALPTGTASFTPATTTNAQSFSVSTIIEVNNVCPCAGTGTCSIPITVTNTGGEATYTFAIIEVVKIA